MREFNPRTYGGFALLLETNRCRSLGADRPAHEMRSPIKQLTIEAAFDGQTVVDRSMAQCCMAGLWLIYDFLDESHAISQGIATAEGSYWHGMMHRREGDFTNAKYWFRKTGDHKIFAPLSERVVEVAGDDPQTDAIDQFAEGPWDPFAFADLCEQVASGLPDIRQECELIQQAEWELLFDHCYRSAI